jgi:hypothetical protein
MTDREELSCDDKLDETLEETFPASDAPANTVETGIAVIPRDDVGIADASSPLGTSDTEDRHE